MFSYSNGYISERQMLREHTRYTNKQKKWKQVVYVKGNVSILMVQGVVPKNTNILCTHK